MSDIVGTSVSNELSSGIESAKLAVNTAQAQEINDLYNNLKLERNKYIQYKILHDTLQECTELNPKIMDIVLSGSVRQCLLLDESCDDTSSTLLGLCDIDRQELNYTEREQLLKLLKLNLDKKYENLCEDFHKVTNKDIKSLGNDNIQMSQTLQMESETKILIELKNKLIWEQEQYVQNLLNLLELLDEITNLRVKKLPQVADQKIRQCELEQKVNYLKSQLAKEKTRVNIFTETSNSLRAYKELIKDIKEQQKDCEKEIQELKLLKEKYDRVSSKQYDDILKSYLQYKSHVEKKRLLYDCLKS